MHTPERLRAAMDCFKRAIEIDDSNEEAQALLGSVLSAYDWDWESATREFERALELDDKNPGTYCYYATHLACVGRYSEAAHTVRLAQASESPVHRYS